MRIMPTMLVKRRPASFGEVSDEALAAVPCLFCGAAAQEQCKILKGPRNGQMRPWRESHYARFCRASKRKR